MQIWNAILSFINNNAPLWSFLVTAATIVYVILTNKMLKESERTRKLQNRPYVIADLRFRGGWLKMTVKNAGNDSASDVKINVNEIQNNPLSNIEFLAPGRELNNILGYVSHQSEKNEDEQNSVYHFHISYKDSSGELYKSDYSIDIAPLLNLTNYNDSENKEIVDKLDKVVDKLKDLNSGISNITGTLKNQSDSVKDISRKIK